MIKLGTTSKKKNNIIFFLFFYAKNLERKIFKKIKYQLEISINNDNSRYKYFHMLKIGSTSKKKKNIALFLIFLCNKV